MSKIKNPDVARVFDRDGDRDALGLQLVASDMAGRRRVRIVAAASW